MNELRPKLFDVMKDYSKEQLIRDIISGIIVAIIALPLSIALAIASGVGRNRDFTLRSSQDFLSPFSVEAVSRSAVRRLPLLSLFTASSPITAQTA